MPSQLPATLSRSPTSPNGRLVLFSSTAPNLDAVLPDTNGFPDVFLRDLQAIVVTTSPGTKPALSGDGRYLGFQ